MVDYAIVGGNNYNIVDLGDPDPLSEFPEIYGNENFSYVVTLTEPSALKYLGVTVNSKPAWVNAANITNSNNSIFISRDPGYTIFPDESYTVVDYDDQGWLGNTETSNIPINEYTQANNKTDYVLSAWNTPSQEEVEGTFSFTLSYEDTGSPGTVDTVNPVYTQNFVWSVQTALPGFINNLNQTMPQTSNTVLEEYGANTSAPFETSNTFTSTTELKDLLANTGIDPTALDEVR
jgi:hypothetical protein